MTTIAIHNGRVIDPALGQDGIADVVIVDGRIAPLVDRVFSFDELPAAKRHMESDAMVGKVVVRMDA